MIRPCLSTQPEFCIVILSALLISGCASFRDQNESLIRVETQRQSVKAERLTLAGVKAMGSGHADYAFEKLLQAVAADEQYGPAHNNLGLLHYDRGELYDAVLSFERATELMPNEPITFYNLGLALEAAGRVHEAMDLYWQAVELEATNPNFLGNLVRLRIRLGEKGPDVLAQLEDLILIETRPDWRQWADRKLALELNETLDRGPEAPDFDTGAGSDRQEDQEPEKSIIDLTPSTGNIRSTVPSPPSPQPIELKPSELKPSELKPSEDELPAPIQDTGSLNLFPSSIGLVSNQEDIPTK